MSRPPRQTPVADHRERIGDIRRLGTLASTGLLDAEAEAAFDRFTKLAARFIGAVTPRRRIRQHDPAVARGHGNGVVHRVENRVQQDSLFAAVDARANRRGSPRRRSLGALAGHEERFYAVNASPLLADGDERQLALFTERVQREIDSRNNQPNRAYWLSASIGGAAFDPGAPEAIDALLSMADALMY